jgi:hypothetical protein
MGGTKPPAPSVWRVKNTQVFLRMAVIERRRITEQAADIAVEFRHVAQKLEAEAEELECFTLSK